MAGCRPTIFISRRFNPFRFEIDDLQLQRTVITLFSSAIRTANHGKSFPHCIADAWRALYRAVNRNSLESFREPTVVFAACANDH